MARYQRRDGSQRMSLSRPRRVLLRNSYFQSTAWNLSTNAVVPSEYSDPGDSFREATLSRCGSALMVCPGECTRWICPSGQSCWLGFVVLKRRRGS